MVRELLLGRWHANLTQASQSQSRQTPNKNRAVVNPEKSASRTKQNGDESASDSLYEKAVKRPRG